MRLFMTAVVVASLMRVAAAQPVPPAPAAPGAPAPDAPAPAPAPVPAPEEPTPTPTDTPPATTPPETDSPAKPATREPEKAKPANGAKITFGKAGELEFYQAVQLWAVYTHDAEAGSMTRPLGPVNDRGDLLIRRGRLGFRGRIDKQNGFNVVFAYDGIGKGPYSGIRGGTNPDNLVFSVLDAVWTWSPEPRFLNVSVGYFRPQVGRLSITGAFANHTFEKSMLQTYQRAHIVARGNGREAGINVGGLYDGGTWSANYNVGMFSANQRQLVGTFNDRWAPLVAARAAITIGDAEMPKYGMSYTTNYFGKRKGITLAVQGTTQGRTDVFDRNSLLGFDVLANYAGLNVVAELHFLHTDFFDDRVNWSRVWYASAGYHIDLPSKQAIEPFAMVMRYSGDPNSLSATGDDEQLEVGINWYVNKNNLKLNLAYGHGDGTARSEYTNGTSFVRGDFVGAGLQYLY